MRLTISVLTIGLLSFSLHLGCARDNSPAAPMVTPPAPGQDTPSREYEPRKPMPDGSGGARP